MKQRTAHHILLSVSALIGVTLVSLCFLILVSGFSSTPASAEDKAFVMSVAAFNASKALCEAKDDAGESYFDYISDDLLRVMAIRGSGCNMAKLDQASHAVGILQIPPEYWETLAASHTSGDQDVLVNLMRTSKKDSAQIGMQGISLMRNEYGNNGAQCVQAGQRDEFVDTGKCPALDENQLYIRMLHGELVVAETNTNLDDPNFGKLTYGTGLVVDGTHDNGRQILMGMRKASKANRAQVANTIQETYYREADLMAANYKKTGETADPVSPIDVRNAYCIGAINEFFDIAHALLGGAAWFDLWFRGIVDSVLEKLCTFVVDAARAIISNVLNSICVPISLGSFNFNLGTMRGKSCSGYSLGSVYLKGANVLTEDQINVGMESLLPDEGFPAINSVPAFRYDSPSVSDLMRRLFGTDADGNNIVH